MCRPQAGHLFEWVAMYAQFLHSQAPHLLHFFHSPKKLILAPQAAHFQTIKGGELLHII